MSPESKIAIARARATMQPKPRVTSLEKVSHPTIVPTAFSTRHAKNNGSTAATAVKVVEIPSSPPLSTEMEVEVPRPAGAEDDEVPTTIASTAPKPKPKTNQSPKTPMQLSSPPGSPEVRLSTAAKRLKSSNYAGGLTSSVVKGEAANGLLELMRGGAAGAGGSVTVEEDVDVLE